MLKTNQDRLVMQSVLGEIQHPTVKELPVRLDCDGVAHTLPNTGSITYNVKLGDSVYSRPATTLSLALPSRTTMPRGKTRH